MTTESQKKPEPAIRPQRPSPGPVTMVALILAAAAVAIGAVVVMPGPPPSLTTAHGDNDLAARARAALAGSDRRELVVVAETDRAGTRFAALGELPGRGAGVPDGSAATGSAATGSAATPADVPMEIGSITKVLTGMLLADLVDDCTVNPDQRVVDVAPDSPAATGPLGQVTLAELAQHRSGLPRLRTGNAVGSVSAALRLSLGGADPYPDWSGDRLLAEAAAAGLSGRGQFRYSNLGVAVLGQLLAARTGVPYPQLLRTRVLQPLGMARTTIVTGAGGLPAGRPDGSAENGAGQDPWISPGYAPAGMGVWSTAADLAILATAIAAGNAPGIDAVEPRADAGDGLRIGFGWFTEAADGRQALWHNGGTGGFESYLAVEQATGRAVVVLSAGAVPVDAAGRRLLGLAVPDGSAQPRSVNPVNAGVTGILILVPPIWLGLLAWRGIRDRLAFLSAAVDGATLLVVARAVGPWAAVPPQLWAAAAVLAVAATAVVAGRWWSGAALVGPAGRPTRIAGAVVTVVVAAGLVAMTVG